MRVLHVVEGWAPVTTGNTVRSWELITAQERRPDVEPHVVVSSRQASYDVDRVEAPAGMEERVHAVPPSAWETTVRRVRPFWANAAHLTAHLVDRGEAIAADLVHGHWSSVIGRAAAAAAKRLGVPFVAEVRFDLAGGVMSESLPFENRWIERALRRWNEQHLAQADAVVAASHSLGEMLEQQFPSLSAPVTVVPNALDTDAFRPGPPPADVVDELGLEDAFVVGSTGSMYRYEGFDRLIDLLAAIQPTYPNVQGLLIGDGPRREALERRAEKTGAPVTFYGPVSREKVRACYRLFDVFAIPRRDVAITRYASPIKLLEAMASGCACVASPVGDIRHALGDGRGLLVGSDRPAGWRTALAELADQPSTARTFGRRARAWAEQRGTWDDAAARHVGVYERVCSSATGSRA